MAGHPSYRALLGGHSSPDWGPSKPLPPLLSALTSQARAACFRGERVHGPVSAWTERLRGVSTLTMGGRLGGAVLRAGPWLPRRPCGLPASGTGSSNRAAEARSLWSLCLTPHRQRVHKTLKIHETGPFSLGGLSLCRLPRTARPWSSWNRPQHPPPPALLPPSPPVGSPTQLPCRSR